MLKSIYFLAFLICFSNSCIGQKKEQKSILKAFDNYKSAILNDKGEEAIRFVDSRTIQYYSDMLELVKTADSTQVASLSILDKLMVLSIRHRTPKEDILSFDGKRLLVYAIKSGMVGKNSVANNSIGEIIVDNNFAKGQLVINGQKTPFYFHFYKQDRQWKIDLTSIFSLSAMAFQKIVDESGQKENDYLVSLLEMITGKKPGGEIWNKVE